MRVKDFSIITAISTAILFAACKTEGASEASEMQTTETTDIILEDVLYTVAKNYFVNNNVDAIDNPTIETSEGFEAIFGMATTMGEAGAPTKIDFENEYVIAVVSPETKLATTITPVSLQKDENNNLIFTYRVEVGEEQSFTSKPCLAIVVAKDISGDVVLKEEER